MAEAEEAQRLNDLIVRHHRSLACYLAGARPWTPTGAEAGVELIVRIAGDHEQAANRFAAEVVRLGERVQPGGFPLAFTGLHDLALPYLLRRLEQSERELLEAIRGARTAVVEIDPLVAGILEEAETVSEANLAALRAAISTGP